MIAKMYVARRRNNDPVCEQLLRLLQKFGYAELSGLRREHVIRAEGITLRQLEQLRPLFVNPLVEQAAARSFFTAGLGPIFEVSFQRAMTDPEMPSFFHGAQVLGVRGVQWVRIALRYQFLGVSRPKAEEITERFLLNKQVQTFILPGEEWYTLIPQGDVGGVEKIDVAHMDEEELARLSDQRRLFLTAEEWRVIQTFYRTRQLTPARDGEIEGIAAWWGDHCFHKTWKRLGLFRDLKEALRHISHPLVVSALSDNSGVMRFYGGWALNVKGETHISPVFGASSYGGTMTEHGGLIRDIIFTGQGSWPYATTTILATCDPRIPWNAVPGGAFHPLIVLLENIRGTKDYTNPMGIPMAWSQYLIHPRNWKGFALGQGVGILPESRAKKGKPRLGDFVVLIGESTGIDGIHGATVSSVGMTHATSRIDAAHVQIGMPIRERVFMEAIPVLRDRDCIRACTDCGAAGLSSAVGELGEDTGVWLNLAWVPLKCASMRPWQILLSESQERGVLCVPEEKLHESLDILSAYGVPAAVIGVISDSHRFQVVYNRNLTRENWEARPLAIMDGEIVVDLPYDFLIDSCPLPPIEVREPQKVLRPYRPTCVPQTSKEWTSLIRRHLAHFNIADQSAAAHQYDQTVQGATVIPYLGGIKENMPDELSVYTPVLRESWGAGVAVATNQFYAEVDPAGCGKLLMAQAMAKLVAAGFRYWEMTANVNVYTPPATDNPENAWRLVQLVRHGYLSASKDLYMPVISGKDSSSGRFDDMDAPLTLSVLALGRMEDARFLIPKPFQQPGDTLVLFHPGLREIHLGGSVLLDLYGERGDALSAIDLRAMRDGFVRYHRMLQGFHWSKKVCSRSAVAEAGLIRRLFEMSIGSGLGCRISLPGDPLDWLFGELSGAILFAVRGDGWKEYLGSEYEVLGEVTAQPMIQVFSSDKEELFAARIGELQRGWSRTFREVVI